MTAGSPRADRGMPILTYADCGACGADLAYEHDGKRYSRLIGVEYPYGHKDRYDGVSEWKCPQCGLRVGRWTGRVLADDETEPRWGGQA